MPLLDLAGLFESLVLPLHSPQGAELAAVPIPGAQVHRIGKDSSGSPCLLIHHGPIVSRPTPIRLEHLMVTFDVPCTITRHQFPPESGRFTIVRCSASNPRLASHFLTVIAPIVVGLGQAPSPSAVRDAINSLVELFQALSAPTRKTIQGLWAELFLICSSSSPVAMATAWHRDPFERFDFGHGPERLEVKSSSSRRREHYFSLDQVSSGPTTRIVVASLFVERAGGGLSLQSLYEEARSRLSTDPALVARFDSVFFRSLGQGWEDAMEESFDRELASTSIAFFSGEAVPRVVNPSPGSVFDVRFRADLGAVAPLSPAELRELGGVFEAAAPRSQG